MSEMFYTGITGRLYKIDIFPFESMSKIKATSSSLHYVTFSVELILLTASIAGMSGVFTTGGSSTGGNGIILTVNVCEIVAFLLSVAFTVTKTVQIGRSAVGVITNLTAASSIV